MLFYLPCVAALVTYYIFNSKGIDYRAVGLGTLLPTAIDIFIGHGSFGHSFIFPTGMLVFIMLITIKQSRLLRRRLLCVVVGVYFALVLEGTFMYETMWWWPLNIRDVKETVRIFPSPLFWILRDVVGLVALYVLFAIGELYKKEKRDVFLRTGRIAS